MRRALLLSLSALACSHEEAPTPPTVHETPASESTTASLFARCAAARDFPLAPPASGIGSGFLSRGQVFFHQDGGAAAGGKSIEQAGELWLGGPSRLRFSLSAHGRSNLFLLADASHSWVKVPGQDFADNPAQVLSEECRLRWEVMRFPWGWEEVLAADEGQREFQRDTEAGPVTIWLDPQLRPSAASFGNASLHLDDWRPAAATTATYPHRWLWTSGADQREERWDSLSDQAFFLVSAFRPPRPEEAVAQAPGAATFDGSALGELSRIDGHLAYLTAEDATTFDDAPPAGAWWRHQEQRYYLPAEQRLLLADSPDGADLPYRHTSSQDWLRWTPPTPLEDALGRARLEAIAGQLGLESDGPSWVLITTRADAPKVFLMPVKPAADSSEG